MSNDAFVTRVVRDHVMHVELGSRLDNSNAPAMLKLITDSLSEGVQFIILDCANVELMSSAGVGSILGSVESLRQNNGDIVLCNLSDQARRVLEVLDLLEYLTVKPTSQEADAHCN
jgi:anti-sigma B factor antagonist